MLFLLWLTITLLEYDGFRVGVMLEADSSGSKSVVEVLAGAETGGGRH